MVVEIFTKYLLNPIVIYPGLVNAILFSVTAGGTKIEVLLELFDTSSSIFVIINICFAIISKKRERFRLFSKVDKSFLYCFYFKGASF